MIQQMAEATTESFGGVWAIKSKNNKTIIREIEQLYNELDRFFPFSIIIDCSSLVEELDAKAMGKMLGLSAKLNKTNIAWLAIAGLSEDHNFVYERYASLLKDSLREKVPFADADVATEALSKWMTGKESIPTEDNEDSSQVAEQAEELVASEC